MVKGRVDLNRTDALRAYAQMLNTLSVTPLEPLLADEFVYESQRVFSALTSKHEFLAYIRPKLETIRSAHATVFAEMGMVTAYGEHQPCVVLSQGQRDNLVGLVLAKVCGDRLSRLDLCDVPPPHTADRSGE